MSDEMTVGVVGAGTMGIGVSHLFGAAGVLVLLVDPDHAALTRAQARIRRNVRLYPMLNGDPADSAGEILDRITFTVRLADLGDADFIVENTPEKWDIKRGVYRELDTIAPERCIFGVNTSAIPIGRIGGITGRPDRVIGTHFMNPAPLKPTVEVIRAAGTSAETVAATCAILSMAGKEGIVVNDSSGFVTNRVAMLTINEAVLLLQEGVAPAVDIDRLFRQCFGHPMGPLRTADLIGLDTVMYSLEVLFDHFNDSKFEPAPLLRNMVGAGHLGQKTGRGFFPYQNLENLP
jgi:3-hydroxybutyryl-CoA dehydrogenase